MKTRLPLTLTALILLTALTPSLHGQGSYLIGTDSWTASGGIIGGSGPGGQTTEDASNDTLATADPMNLGGEHLGEIPYWGDVDWVSLTVAAGETIVAETKQGWSLSDSTLTVADDQGVTLAFDDSSGPGSLSRLTYTFGESGTYYLGVRGDANRTGTYCLSVRPDGPERLVGGWVYIQNALEAVASSITHQHHGGIMVLGPVPSTARTNDAGAAYRYAAEKAAENSPLNGGVQFISGASDLWWYLDLIAYALEQGVATPAIIVIPGSRAPNSMDSGENSMVASKRWILDWYRQVGGGLIAHEDAVGTNGGADLLEYLFDVTVTSETVDPRLTPVGKFAMPGLSDGDIAADAHGYFTGHNLAVFASAASTFPGPFSGRTVVESEPNDAAASADPFEVGDNFRGSLARPDDDVLTFRGTVDERVRITVGLAPTLDCVLTLLDADGQTILRQESGTGQLEIEWRASRSDNLYLHLADPSDGTGDYSVQLRTIEPGPDRDVVIGSLAGPWVWLGNGLPGELGEPFARGYGPLVPGTGYTIKLSGAPPFTMVHLDAGPNVAYYPFKGGVMVPHPSMIAAFTTDARGELSLSGTVPPSTPAGTVFYAQFWVFDSSGPRGITASNGFRMTTR